jgi:hypothetical protein
MSATTRRILDMRGVQPGRFRAEQVPPRERERLRASIAERLIAKQMARLEAQRGAEQ